MTNEKLHSSLVGLNDASDGFFDVSELSDYDQSENAWPFDFSPEVYSQDSRHLKLSTAAVFVKRLHDLVGFREQCSTREKLSLSILSTASPSCCGNNRSQLWGPNAPSNLGKLPQSEKNGDILNWVKQFLDDKTTIAKLVDSTLESYNDIELHAVCEAIQGCVQPNPRQRSSMTEVVEILRRGVDI